MQLGRFRTKRRFPFALGAVTLAALLTAGCGGGGGSSAMGIPLAATQVNTTQSTGSTLSRKSATLASYASVVLSDSPALYFPLDDGSGSTATDASVNHHNGQYTGAYSFGGQKILASGDNTTTFNGGAIQVPQSSVQAPTQSITLEAWVNASSTAISAKEAKIISDGVAWAAPYESYKLELLAGRPNFNLVLNGQQTPLLGNITFSPNTAYHVVGTYDGSYMRMYVNGELVGIQSEHGAIGNYTKYGLAISADISGSSPFLGGIASVAIYPVALSLNRILMHEAAAGNGAAYPASVLASSPLAYYRMNEHNGPTMYDASMNAQNLTYSGGSSPGSAGYVDAADSAATFSGANAVNVPHNGFLFPSSAVTVEAVVQPAAASLGNNEAKIFAAGNPWQYPYDAYKLSLVGGKPAVQVALNGSYVQLKAANPLSAGGTYHLAGSYDGAYLRLFVNGVLVASRTASGKLANSSDGAGVGGDYCNALRYTGSLSELAIYPTPLSQSTITQHASLISGLTPYAAPAATFSSSLLALNPVAFYRMDDTGGVLADSSASTNNGSYGSGMTLGVAGFTGDGDTAAAFSGNAAAVPASSSLQPGAAVTVSALVQPAPSALNGEAQIASYGSSASYKLALENGKPTMSVLLNGVPVQAVADGALSAGATYHLSGSYDGQSVGISINGVLARSIPAGGAIGGYGTGGLQVGAGFNGTLDEVAIYPSALSTGTISSALSLIPALAPLPSLAAAGISMSPSRMQILSLGASANVSLSESGVGSFSQTNTCLSIASISGGGGNFTVTGNNPGSCTITFDDGMGNTATLPVSITTTSISGQ